MVQLEGDSKYLRLSREAVFVIAGAWPEAELREVGPRGATLARPTTSGPACGRFLCAAFYANLGRALPETIGAK